MDQRWGWRCVGIDGATPSARQIYGGQTVDAEAEADSEESEDLEESEKYKEKIVDHQDT